MTGRPLTVDNLRDFYDAHPYGPPVIRDGLREVADLKTVASLLLVLQDLKEECRTFVEKRATEDCIEAVREAFGVKP